MQTIDVAFESEDDLVVPSGGVAQKLCGVGNRGTWKRVRQALGIYGKRQLNLDDMVLAITLQEFVRLGKRRKGISVYSTFLFLLQNYGLEFIHEGIANELERPLNKKTIKTQILRRYNQCRKDLMKQSMKPSDTQPPLMQVKKLQTAKKPPKKTLLEQVL